MELCTYQRRLTSRKAGRTAAILYSQKEDDKRNTYIEITDKGEELLLRLMEEYNPENNSVFNGALALRNFYGKFPENIELIAILRNIYGQEFIDILRNH